MRILIQAGLLLATFAGAAAAQPALTGTWEGSSTCTDRKLAPGCRDEHVIYVFTGAGEKLHLVADKVVDGVRSTMYEIDLAPDGHGGWFHRFDAPNGFAGRWQYGAPAGAALRGELVDANSGAQVRSVAVTRQP
jgi:hypothetical protein